MAPRTLTWKTRFPWNVPRLKYSIYLYSPDSLPQIQLSKLHFGEQMHGSLQHLSVKRKAMKIHIKAIAISTKEEGALQNCSLHQI